MAWYTRDKAFDGDVREYEREAWKRTQLLPPVKETCMTVQFGHIMSGGYSAGYYSYKWAEVLDADAFSVSRRKEYSIRMLPNRSGTIFYQKEVLNTR